MSAELDNWFTARAIVSQVDTLADTIGRLRRRTTDEYADHLLERAAACTDALDALLHPTAGELVAHGVHPPSALQEVDTHVRALRLLLCEPAR